MKAAAIILMSIGLVVFIKDAQAITPEQIEKLKQFIKSMNQVIQIDQLGDFLEDKKYSGGDRTKIDAFIKTLDTDQNKLLELIELLQNSALLDFIQTKLSMGEFLKFFAEKCGMSKDDLRRILLLTKVCTEGNVEADLHKMDSSGLVIDIAELKKNDDVATKLADRW